MIKVLLIDAYPIQNVEPHRLLAKMDDLEVQVVYCTNPSGNLKKGNEFINQQQFDIEVLDSGYPWKILKNISPSPNLSKFWGLINPSVVSHVLRSDCVVVYGHAYISFWLAILAAKLSFKKLILTTDATYAESPDNRAWKVGFKKWFFPFLYNTIAHRVWVPSTESKIFLMSMGVKENRIEVTPYTVDNAFILSRRTLQPTVRTRFNIPSDAVVAVFCAKFIPRKRPQDAVLAFAQSKRPNTYLLLIGDGPLKGELETIVKEYGIEKQVIFAGLVNYSQLPDYYSESDFLVFTSETEQFGLPVNEAMLCGLPVLISDRIGCRHDLVEEGGNGYTYPCADVPNLAQKMNSLFLDHDKRRVMSKRSVEIIGNWSPETNALVKLNSIRSLFPRA